MTMRKVPSILSLILLTVAAGAAVAAVPGHRELPAVDAGDLPALTYPLPDRTALAAEDKAAADAGEPYRFALPAEVAFTPGNAGVWSRTTDGLALWRLRLASPGALSLNLGFTTCDLPPTARLVLRPAGGGDALVYTADELVPGRELWTPVLLTDDLVVELTVAPADRDGLRLELTRFNRGYRYFGAPRSDKAGACNIDVVCPDGDDWRAEIRSVGVYQLSGSFKCTGAMVNNTALDSRPLFLTASHCNVTAANDQTVVVYWNFESPTCGALDGGSLADNQSGSTLLANSAASDFCLLELVDDPDPAWRVTFAGWNHADAVPPAVVTIHHPSTDEKSISFDDGPLTTTSYLQVSSPGDGTHLRVAAWDRGTTEPGSSGAPLFDSNRRIVGQLHGGYASCELPNESDWFGRLARAWEGQGTPITRLRDWLDPAGTGAVTLDLLDPSGGVLSVTPAVGVEFAGPLGGPFTPPATTYTLTNIGVTALEWNATTGASWLAVVPAAGTLAPGAQAMVTVVLSAAAGDLAAGSYRTDLDFTNLDGGFGDLAVAVGLTILGQQPQLVGVGPNPFRTFTTVTYTLGVPVRVHGRVYDIRGRLVADLGTDDPGVGDDLVWEWYGRDQAGRLLPSGRYFLELDAEGYKLKVPVTFLH